MLILILILKLRYQVQGASLKNNPHQRQRRNSCVPERFTDIFAPLLVRNCDEQQVPQQAYTSSKHQVWAMTAFQRNDVVT